MTGMQSIDTTALLASVRRAVEQQERERVQAVRDQYYAVKAPIVFRSSRGRAA